MSKDVTEDLEAAHRWLSKHREEGMDLKAVEAGIKTVETLSSELRMLKTQVEETGAKRKEAVKVLKSALKLAKEARKAKATETSK